jgi:uncharacterized RDD family membrane protein YckC
MLSVGDHPRTGVDNPSELREHYGRLSDADLQSIAAIDSDSLTPEARQALANELARRQLRTAGKLPNAMPERVERSAATGEFRYPKARLGARFVAYILDGLVMMVPAVVLGGILFVLQRRSGFGPIAGIGLLLGIAWALYYSFAKDGWNRGQSIGKKAMDLMVVNVRTNVPCTIGESALRALILLLLNMIPGVGWLIEPIVVLVSENGRRLGDLAAGTQVIDTSAYIAGS